jgi:hypothetical protein
MPNDCRDALTATSSTALRPTRVEPLEQTLVTRDQRQIVRFLHDVVKLGDAEISEATGGVHEVTVRRWRGTTPAGAPRCVDRIDDLRAIVGLLLNSRLLYPEEVGRFLRSRNTTLGYSRPLTLLGQGDQFNEVRRAAEQLLSSLRGLGEEHPGEESPRAVTTSQDDAALPAGMTRIPLLSPATHRAT